MLSLCLAGIAGAGAARAQDFAPPTSRPGLEKVGHIIVLYLENRSFDNLYGLFPGADGLAQATDAPPQVDRDGTPYATLPPVIDTSAKPPIADPRFPSRLPNAPFRIEPFVGIDQPIGDLVHRWYQEQAQIDGGRMDRFAAISDAQGLTMGYYDGSRLPMWVFAREYVLADHFFHGAFGGSFLNHIYLVCACAPRYDNAPADMVAKVDSDGTLLRDGQVTPDGYAVNTIQSANMPHRLSIRDSSRLLPPQHAITIGDRLSEKGVSWAWYSAGWNDAVAGHPDRLFQFHHQPFAYFAQFGDGTPGRAAHLKDETDLLRAIADGRLPAVTFYKPLGDDNEHPGYAALLRGDQHTADLVRRIQASPVWKDSIIIVTYDENGGIWDHVAPPRLDRWGPGTRVPTLLISPFAKRGFVDHTPYDTASILKLIETRFHLAPLGNRDAVAYDLTNGLAGF